ncbi:MAG TPA: Crp/Fnr family transcriptional regulator [Roseiflexaceae bacterium]|nr:Crp/Fnr family transcriptional regulator [Roseiflexaceae bacterium]
MAVDIQVIRRVPLFAGLAPEVQVALAGIGVPLRRPAGATLFLEGDPAAGLYIVVEGRVKIMRTSAAGREQVLHVFGPGQHFNHVPVFDGGPCAADAVAQTEVTLALLPSDALRELVARSGSLAMMFLTELSGRLRQMVNLVDNLALHSVQGRLAGLLLAQADAAERGEPVHALSQAEMAARLGTVREMIGRSLKTFESLGLVEINRGSIVVVDREGLAQQAEM